MSRFGEAPHVQARAAHQRAVDIGLGNQLADIVRFDAAAINQVAPIGRIAAEPLTEPLANVRVRIAACAAVAVRPVPIAQTGS